MGRYWVATLAGLVLSCSVAGAAGASEAASEKSRCKVLSAEGSIRVVVCPKGLDQEGLRRAGVEACGVVKYCNAWIWDSEEKAPKYSPRIDSDLAQEDVGNAVAVWANDSTSLLKLEKVKK